MHLSFKRQDGDLSVILTTDMGIELDLGKCTLANGFAITGLDTAATDRSITLSCGIVIDDLDVSIDVLKAHLVDADGNSIPGEQISEAMRAQVEAAGATVNES